MQHAAGFILMENVRREAVAAIDQPLSDEAKAAARKAVDDTMFALTMLIDGVTGGLTNGKQAVDLDFVVRLTDDERVVEQLSLIAGDGVCMGWHGWREGDFGDDEVAIKR
jgi:hypothetical protein